jgi:RNA polymerase sigma-70 factor (ECF subfamily)
MNDFDRLVEAQIPRLRRYARALTRDLTRADDLVQSCLTRAIAKQHLWQPGTEVRAHAQPACKRDPALGARGRQCADRGRSTSVDDSVQRARRTSVARSRKSVGKLAPEQRQVILFVGLEGTRYEEVASILDIPIGTVRSRLWRGPDQMRKLTGMDDEVSALHAPEIDRDATHPRAA